MNIVIPSLGRPNILKDRTLKALSTFPLKNIYIFVIHDEFEKYSTILPKYNIIKSVLGCNESKRFISNFFDEGQRLVFLDDDIKEFYIKNGNKLKPIDALDLFNKSFDEMTKYNASLCGIYPSKNTYFMGDRTRIGLCFCIGQYQALFNRKHIFNTFEYRILEDYERSIRYFFKYNVIRLDNYTLDANYNKLKGGWQTNSQLRHTELKTKELERFISQYGDYCYLKSKKNGKDIIFKSSYSLKSKVVNTLWIDKGACKKLLELTIKSWLDHGYTINLYTNDLDLFKHKDITCIDYKFILDVETDDILHFADLFRYLLLYNYGGIWIDADMVLINYFEFDQVSTLISSEHTFQKGAFKSYNTYKPNIGILKFPVKSPFLKKLIEYIENKLPNFDKPNEYMDIFRKRLLKTELKQYIKEPIFSCGVPWWNVKEMYEDIDVFDVKYGVHPPTVSTILEQSTAIHFWNNFSHNRHSIDLDKSNENSLYKILVKKYNHINF